MVKRALKPQRAANAKPGKAGKAGKATKAGKAPKSRAQDAAAARLDPDVDVAEELGESGKHVLESIERAQREAKKQSKKGKAAMRLAAAHADGEDEDLSDDDQGLAAAARGEEDYDSEEEALRQILAERAARERKNKKNTKRGAKTNDEEDSDDDDDEGDEDEDDEDDEDDEEDRKRDEAVLERLDDIKLKLPFSETLTLTAEDPTTFDEAEDDLKREVEFYNQALRAVKAGRARLDEEKVPHFRPIDYFADMIKSDEHMARVKQNLLFEKKKIEAFEQRKKQQEYKKYAKKVQAEKLKEKAARKKRDKDFARDFREKSSNNLDLANGTGRKRSRSSVGDQGKGTPNKRRQQKNEKFGLGPGRRSRKNDTDSTGSLFVNPRDGKKKSFGKGRRRK